jgi:hypothetical protein
VGLRRATDRKTRKGKKRASAYFFLVGGGLVNENVVGATGGFFGCFGFLVSRLLRF